MVCACHYFAVFNLKNNQNDSLIVSFVSGGNA